MTLNRSGQEPYLHVPPVLRFDLSDLLCHQMVDFETDMFKHHSQRRPRSQSIFQMLRSKDEEHTP